MNEGTNWTKSFAARLRKIAAMTLLALALGACGGATTPTERGAADLIEDATDQLVLTDSRFD